MHSARCRFGSIPHKRTARQTDHASYLSKRCVRMVCACAVLICYKEILRICCEEILLICYEVIFLVCYEILNEEILSCGCCSEELNCEVTMHRSRRCSRAMDTGRPSGLGRVSSSLVDYTS